MSGTDWGNPDATDYQQQHIVTINTDGLSFQVNENVATQFAGFIHALVQAGYHPKSVGGYNNRPVTGGTTKSNHAYGAAIDIDPDTNPRYGNAKGGKYALPPNVGQLAAQYGLVWGGNYTKTKDYMHFEAAGAPATPKALSARVTTMATTGTTTAAGTAATEDRSKWTKQQVIDYVAANYGYAAQYLNDKEIGPILLRAAIGDGKSDGGGWDKNKLLGALQKTKWWKQHSEANVAWDYKNQAHPADAQQDLHNEMSRIGAIAQQQGIVLTGLQVHDLAVNSLRNGWNDSFLNNAMHYHAKIDPNKVAADYGQYTALAQTNPEIKNLLTQAQANNWSQAQFNQAVQNTNWFRTTPDAQRTAQLTLAADPASVKASTSSMQDTMRQKASAYMVPISDVALSQWVTRIQQGDVTPDSFDSYLKEQAKSLFPGMTHALDAGLTVAQYVDPYKQYAAQTLELNPDSIDMLNDPKFSRALFNTDPKTGQRTQMSLSDWQTYLKTLPEYNKTAQAQSQAADMAVMLTKTLGQVA